MPPRIPNQRVSNSLLPYISSSSSPSPTTLTLTASHQRTPFSTTPTPQTRLRAQMFEWLNGEGSTYKTHIPGNTNYLQKRFQEPGSADDSKPFPLNPYFESQSILSEELRNEIYERVAVKKKSVRAVSAEMGVDMRRVGAVVRLVELERRAKSQGKPLALPYARAIHEMVPTTPLYEDPLDQRRNPHESINDLPEHKLTRPQIFYPVPESRQFTRVDAGRVFSAAPRQKDARVQEYAEDPSGVVTRITQRPDRLERVGKGADEQQVLQPADARIPHPHLVAHERHRIENPHEHRQNRAFYNELLEKTEKAEAERRRIASERRESQMKKVAPEDSRFEFRFKNVVVSRETTGLNGRGADAPGRRYGVPNAERKKGQVKIPTRVDA